MGEIPVLDDTCIKCEKDGRGTYTMGAACYNCGQKAVIRYSKGHEASPCNGPACPNCGCGRWALSQERAADA